MNDRIRHAKQQEGPREGVSPVSINITLFISSYRYYAITHTDYTQSLAIYTCNRGQAQDACSFFLVIISVMIASNTSQTTPVQFACINFHVVLYYTKHACTILIPVRILLHGVY